MPDRNTLTRPRLNPDRQGRDLTLTNPASLRRRQGGSRGHGPPVVLAHPDRVRVTVATGAAVLRGYVRAETGRTADRLHASRFVVAANTATGSTATATLGVHTRAIVPPQMAGHPVQVTGPDALIPLGKDEGKTQRPEPTGAAAASCATPRVSRHGRLHPHRSSITAAGVCSPRSRPSARSTSARSPSKPLDFADLLETRDLKEPRP